MKKNFLIIVLILGNNLKAQWQPKGPEGGSVKVFAKMNKNIFAATSSQVFKSIDNSANWVVVNKGLPIGGVNALAVKQNIIFAATNTGLYKSTDSGEIWLPVSISPIATQVRTLYVKGDTIYTGLAATNSILGTGGVFLSVDNGINWKIDNNGLPFQQFISINCIAISNSYIIITGNLGCFSKKTGDTIWKKADIGMNLTVFKLNVSGNAVFASTSTTRNGEFVTRNYGQSWAKVKPPSPNDTIFNIMTVKGGTIYAKGVKGFYSSDDTGNTWTMISDNSTMLFKSGYINSINAYDNYLFAATNLNVLLSDDGGINWAESNKGLSAVSIRSLVNKDTSLIVCGTITGIKTTNIKGNNWNSAKLPDGLSYGVLTLFVNNDSVWAGTQGGMYSTKNAGKTWIYLDNELRGKSVMSFAANGNKIYAGTSSGIFISTNKGINWVLSNSGLTNKYIYSILVSDSGVFAGTAAGVFRSNNNGSNWNAVNTSFIGKYVPSLAQIGTKILAATDSGIFVSVNNGNTWQKANTGLRNKAIVALCVFENKIFVGTSNSVYMSIDSAKNWMEINTGFPGDEYFITFLIKEDYIFAGTNSGVWRRPLSELNTNSFNEKINKLTLRIYPNPANNYLYFSSENTKIKQATIYDCQGKLLLQQNLVEDRINVEQLLPGLYFLRAFDINENAYTAKFIKD